MDRGDEVIKVFRNAAEKVSKYNKYYKICNGGRYNRAYHNVLNARGKQICLVGEDCRVDKDVLAIIEQTLKTFDMGRQMDSTFEDRLREKLSDAKTKTLLKKFRKFAILSSNIKEIKSDTQDLFETLSARGSDGLSSRGDRFGVGATKIMNFLFPELFVMADSNVMKGLHKTGLINSPKYWSIMMICHGELKEWQETHGNVKSLIELDQQPITLTRIFDKCAFVMGKFKL